MLSDVKRGILYTFVTMALFGVVYPVLVWGVGRVLFPAEAEGSLVRRGDGTIVGSSLVAQPFTKPEYFRPRPSGVDYDAASTGGTNHGPSNPDHRKAVGERLASVIALEGVEAAAVPSEMVTASGAGLDPHIPPAGAEIQVARVARARGVDAERIRELVHAHTEGPLLGFYGRPGVNVLRLNLALDQALGAPGASETE